MAMSYTTLTGAKGQSGAIATWAKYSLLDTAVIVDEAQTLLYGEGNLRTREMMTEILFTMQGIPLYSSYFPLPARFLDPIGRINCTSFNTFIRHKGGNELQNDRNYTEQTGTLNANPFTTTAGSNTVSVNLPSHGFSQDSVFYTTGATTFNGVSIVGTFPVSSIVDLNNFTIDISILGTTPTGSSTDGGSAATYICDFLTFGTPTFYGIWNERINFDTAFFQTTLCRLQYYQSLPLLSATNQTNFLTNRYPNLMRTACLAAAADFMRDTEEYQKQFGRLTQQIEAISIQDDMHLRGLELTPDIP